MKHERIDGTNCYNCKYIAEEEEAVDPKELNDLGGINPKDIDEMDRAKEGDLITLPGGSKAGVLGKKFCHHGKIHMYVTARMCCAYWDHDGVVRPWE